MNERLAKLCVFFIQRGASGARCARPRPLLIAYAFFAASALPAAVALAGDADSIVWFDAPASHFTESTPLGNGRLGGMFFGGVDEDAVLLCESGMWSGSPQDADRADAASALPEIRRLLFAGDVLAAERIMNDRFTCAGAGSGLGRGAHIPYGSYQTLGKLTVTYEQAAVAPVEDYRRELHLDSAMAVLTHRRGEDRTRREAFVSAADQALVYRLMAAEGRTLLFTVALSRPERAAVAADGDDALHMHGRLDDGRNGDAGVRYSARVRVLTEGGKVAATGDAIQVSGAAAATILVTAATEGGSFGHRPGRAEELSRADLDAAAGRTYDELKARHITDYWQFYDRAELRLGGATPPATEKAAPATPRRLAAAWAGADDPGLAALYFNFGRYLLISSSRPGGFPANLQGIWAEGVQTPWNGDWHLNVNVQMNYWLAEPCQLSELHEPLFALIESLVEPGRKTARAYYDAEGWCAHVLANPWGFTSPGESASWGATSTGGVWLCHHLWQHYEFTQDRAFLKRAYPLLRGAAKFALGVLVEDPRSGALVTAPSNSPENSYFVGDEPAHICVGSTMDMQLMRALLQATAAAADVLHVDEEFAETLRAAEQRLLPTRIAADGRIREWSEEVREVDPAHRHISHLWGLYPGQEIDARGTPELAAAARKSLDARGDDGTGWSLAYKLAMRARLGDGERAFQLLRRHLMPVSIAERDIRFHGGTYPNLFDAHPPFQIDGNLGGAAAIAEMLLQSRLSGDPAQPQCDIELLPALPAAWTSGKYRGLCARGGFVVDVAWSDGKLTAAKVRSNCGLPATLHCGETTAPVSLAAGETASFDAALQPLEAR